MRKYMLIAAVIAVFAFGTFAQEYSPKKADVEDQLYWVLGATGETLGWDNVYCGISIDKSVALFAAYQGYQKEGGSKYNFAGDSMATLNNLSTTVNQLVSKGEGLDPASVDAKDYKKKIEKMRTTLRPPAAPVKKPIPEDVGNKMKEGEKERGDALKRKWAERGN